MAGLKTPQKRRDFTFVIKANDENRVAIIKQAEQCPAYAYILHDKDKDTDPHYHFFIQFPNPRSFHSVAEDIGIPTNVLQKVISRSGLAAYLTHDNEPTKFHYSKQSIISNIPIENLCPEKLELSGFLDDFDKLRRGEIGYREFMMTYTIHCATLGL